MKGISNLEDLLRRVGDVEESLERFEEALSSKKAEESVLPALDKSRFTYTLVLDLDETLVHFEATERKFRLRPGCLGFLRSLSAPYFEIVVFTAAS